MCRSNCVLTSYACKYAEAQKRAARQSIKEAMMNQDVDKLKQAIADASGLLSDSELAQAKKQLDFLKISQGKFTLNVLLINLCIHSFSVVYSHCL